MDSNFDKLLEETLNELYLEKLEEITEENKEEYTYQELEEEQIKKLAEKIQLLKFEDSHLLMEKYYHKNSPSMLEDIFHIEKPKEKSIYLNKMLAQFMGLENKLISDSSFEEACQIVNRKDMEEFNKAYLNKKIRYSKNFKEKMKTLGIKEKKKSFGILKKVAVIILILLSSTTLFLATNAEAREKLFDWIIKDFGEYSSFIAEEINFDYIEKAELEELNVGYVPEGFELIKDEQIRTIRRIEYSYGEKYFVIKFLDLEKTNNYIDRNTENSELIPIEINENNGYYWELESYNSLLWQQNGIECSIHGNLEKDQLFKIGENIYK